jgi:hypothetical protein
VLRDKPAQVQRAMAVASGAPDLDPGHAAIEVAEALDVAGAAQGVSAGRGAARRRKRLDAELRDRTNFSRVGQQVSRVVGHFDP